MSSVLILGSVVFSSFEIPERISLGGKQKLVVHSLPGGGRIVDAMGPDDAPIRWSGVFSGSNAASRVRTLERLRRSGSQVSVAWAAWRFNVVVEEFEAEFENATWIPYRIQLCVVPNAQDLVGDWLAAAAAPVLSVPMMDVGALNVAIAATSSTLAAGTLASLVAASGELANYVTRRAYSGSGS